MTAEKTGKSGRAAKLNFEQSMARLEKIVADMERGELSLEDMIARFEEGQKLILFCTKKLNEVERKIEVLVKKGDDLVAEPFDPDAAAPAESADAESDEAEDADDELF